MWESGSELTMKYFYFVWHKEAVEGSDKDRLRA